MKLYLNVHQDYEMTLYISVHETREDANEYMGMYNSMEENHKINDCIELELTTINELEIYRQKYNGWVENKQFKKLEKYKKSHCSKCDLNIQKTWEFCPKCSNKLGG